MNLEEGGNWDAWAGTFEGVVGELTSPIIDCPETLPDVAALRTTETKEDGGLSVFQNEIVQTLGWRWILSWSSNLKSGFGFLGNFEEDEIRRDDIWVGELFLEEEMEVYFIKHLNEIREPKEIGSKRNHSHEALVTQ
ncbi:hypothetical protein LWI28_014753 [Acer negundo]|uniref:Uncharacterized protein n=1 Tax=Acer negundo TaxID=4023 RepID=A0AAD5JKU1_ACENE|nr:hypothetical protein LWI28_014753 [Acer negundo]